MPADAQKCPGYDLGADEESGAYAKWVTGMFNYHVIMYQQIPRVRQVLPKIQNHCGWRDALRTGTTGMSSPVTSIVKYHILCHPA